MILLVHGSGWHNGDPSVHCIFSGGGGEGDLACANGWKHVKLVAFSLDGMQHAQIYGYVS